MTYEDKEAQASYCVSQCPSDRPYRYAANDDNKCLSECPLFYDGLVCREACPVGSKIQEK